MNFIEKPSKISRKVHNHENSQSTHQQRTLRGSLSSIDHIAKLHGVAKSAMFYQDPIFLSAS